MAEELEDEFHLSDNQINGKSLLFKKNFIKYKYPSIYCHRYILRFSYGL
jgi:hypothetical protein